MASSLQRHIIPSLVTMMHVPSEAQFPAGVAGSGAVRMWKALGNTEANDIQQPPGFQTKSCRRWGSGDGAIESTLTLTPLPPMALPHKTSP